MKGMYTSFLSFLCLSSLVGCSSGVTLPEGEVVMMKQDVVGDTNLLLSSADYGEASTTIASVILESESAYRFTVTLESYEGNVLQDTQEVMTYETDVVTDESIYQLIMNAGSGAIPSIFSISEYDVEKMEETDYPVYQMTKSYLPALTFDEKFDFETLGASLDEDIQMSAYVVYKTDDEEKKPLILEDFEQQLSQYERVSILKARVEKIEQTS